MLPLLLRNMDIDICMILAEEAAAAWNTNCMVVQPPQLHLRYAASAVR